MRGATRCALAALALLLPALGCTKPEDEPPVSLQPGLYEVRAGGSTVIELKSGERTGRICLDATATSYLPTDPLASLVEPWENCISDIEPPKGNAIRGARRCEGRKTPMRAVFSGSHTTDSFEIQGEVTQGDDEGGGVMHLGSGEFSISGKRTGNCVG